MASFTPINKYVPSLIHDSEPKPIQIETSSSVVGPITLTGEPPLSKDRRTRGNKYTEEEDDYIRSSALNSARVDWDVVAHKLGRGKIAVRRHWASMKQGQGNQTESFPKASDYSLDVMSPANVSSSVAADQILNVKRKSSITAEEKLSEISRQADSEGSSAEPSVHKSSHAIRKEPQATQAELNNETVPAFSDNQIVPAPDTDSGTGFENMAKPAVSDRAKKGPIQKRKREEGPDDSPIEISSTKRRRSAETTPSHAQGFRELPVSATSQAVGISQFPDLDDLIKTSPESESTGRSVGDSSRSTRPLAAQREPAAPNDLPKSQVEQKGREVFILSLSPDPMPTPSSIRTGAAPMQDTVVEVKPAMKRDRASLEASVRAIRKKRAKVKMTESKSVRQLREEQARVDAENLALEKKMKEVKETKARRRLQASRRRSEKLKARLKKAEVEAAEATESSKSSGSAGSIEENGSSESISSEEDEKMLMEARW